MLTWTANGSPVIRKPGSPRTPRSRSAARRGEEHAALAEIIFEDDARQLRGEPSAIHELAREWVENFRSRKTPAERAARAMAAADNELGRALAAGRWRAFIAEPGNIDALIGLAALASRPGCLAALTAVVDAELLDAEQREAAHAVI